MHMEALPEVGMTGALWATENRGADLEVLQGAGGLVLFQRLLDLLLQHGGQRGVPRIPQQMVGLLQVPAADRHLQAPAVPVA